MHMGTRAQTHTHTYKCQVSHNPFQVLFCKLFVPIFIAIQSIKAQRVDRYESRGGRGQQRWRECERLLWRTKIKNQCDLKWCMIITGKTSAHETEDAHGPVAIPFSNVDTILVSTYLWSGGVFPWFNPVP